jgi:polyisoprenyl-phosphate glycosyltransferase
MSLPELSIILPCYNESKNIPILLERLEKFWPRISFELILVNNGSTDNTTDVILSLQKQYSFLRTILIKKNVGYGHGVFSGLKEARAEVLSYSHADIQTPPEDIIRAYDYYKNNNFDLKKVLIKGLRINRRKEEQLFSKGLEIFASFIFGSKMKDINGQPKLFGKSLFHTLNNPPDGFSFDVYLMRQALRNDFKITTIPVDFGVRAYGESKWSISFFLKHKTIFKYFQSITIMWLREKF